MEVHRSPVTFPKKNYGQIMSFLVLSFQEMPVSVLGVDDCLVVAFFGYST